MTLSKYVDENNQEQFYDDFLRKISGFIKENSPIRDIRDRKIDEMQIDTREFTVKADDCESPVDKQQE